MLLITAETKITRLYNMGANSPRQAHMPETGIFGDCLETARLFEKAKAKLIKYGVKKISFELYDNLIPKTCAKKKKKKNH